MDYSSWMTIIQATQQLKYDEFCVLVADWRHGCWGWIRCRCGGCWGWHSLLIIRVLATMSLGAMVMMAIPTCVGMSTLSGGAIRTSFMSSSRAMIGASDRAWSRAVFDDDRRKPWGLLHPLPTSVAEHDHPLRIIREEKSFVRFVSFPTFPIKSPPGKYSKR